MFRRDCPHDPRSRRLDKLIGPPFTAGLDAGWWACLVASGITSFRLLVHCPAERSAEGEGGAGRCYVFYCIGFSSAAKTRHGIHNPSLLRYLPLDQRSNGVNGGGIGGDKSFV